VSAQRNNLTVLLLIACAVLVIFNIQSCAAGMRQKKAREKEMAVRLDAEEKLAAFSGEKQAFEEKLKAKEQELIDEKTAHQATKKSLLQEQLVNQGLKEELARLGPSSADVNGSGRDKSKKTKK
jgi:hypothetical protein